MAEPSAEQAPRGRRRILLGVFVLAGVVSGALAVAFHQYFKYTHLWLLDNALEQTGVVRVLLIVGIPTTVAALLGYIVQRVVPTSEGANLARVRRSYGTDPTLLDRKTVLSTFFLTPLSLGSGAPLGPEGPTVVVTSGVSMWMARLFGLPRKVQRGMIPIGTAAGIAAIFRAPITGVVFAIEELLGTTSKSILGGAIIAAVAAATVQQTILGRERILPASAATWNRAWELIGFAVVGIVAGLVSGAALRIVTIVRARFRLNPSLVVRGAIGGACVGLIGLFQPAVLGVGYETTALFVRGGGSLESSLAAFGAKAVAFMIAAAAGMLGGTFAPSLFLGSSLGAAIGHLARELGRTVDPGAYALAGMGAYFAGTLRCPITAVLIVLELTNDYGLIVPVMLAVVLSTTVSRYISSTTLEEDQLEREGYRLAAERRDPVAAMPVREVMSRTPLAFSPQSHLGTIVDVTRGQRHRVYPIVDDSGRLMGLIEGEELGRRVREGRVKGVAAEIMRPVPMFAREDEVVHDVLLRMQSAGVDRCPVVSRSGALVGFLSPGDLMQARFRYAETDETLR